MAIAEDKVRLQIVVDKKAALKVERFAKRMGVSNSRMGAMLVESAIENEGWLIEIMTSALAKKVCRALGVRKKPEEESQEEG